MYSKLALLSIDEHKYSKSKYSKTRVQAAPSSKEPLLPPQCPQTSSGTATGHRDTCPVLAGIISLLSKGNLDFICLLHFREEIRGMGCLGSLVMTATSVFCPQCWTHTRGMNTTHLLPAPLTCQCDTFTGHSSQHTPASALVLHKLQQGHSISHLALYTFIALEHMPSIKKML